MCPRFSAGFTLVELIAVLLIIGLLAATVSTILIPSRSFQLQSSRDQIVSSLASSQHRAMHRINTIEFSSGGSQVDIREDTDGDGDFSDEISLNIGGVQYPLSLLSSQTISTGSFRYDRLGKTTGGDLTLSQGSSSVTITVTDSGFAY